MDNSAHMSSPSKVVPVRVVFPFEQLPAQLSSFKDATRNVCCESGIPQAHKWGGHFLQSKENTQRVCLCKSVNLSDWNFSLQQAEQICF